MTGRAFRTAGNGYRSLTVQIPSELHDAITDAAAERAVGRVVLVEHLLRAGLARLLPIEQTTATREAQPSRVVPIPSGCCCSWTLDSSGLRRVPLLGCSLPGHELAEWFDADADGS